MGNKEQYDRLDEGLRYVDVNTRLNNYRLYELKTCKYSESTSEVIEDLTIIKRLVKAGWNLYAFDVRYVCGNYYYALTPDLNLVQNWAYNSTGGDYEYLYSLEFSELEENVPHKWFPIVNHGSVREALYELESRFKHFIDPDDNIGMPRVIRGFEALLKQKFKDYEIWHSQKMDAFYKAQEDSQKAWQESTNGK